MVQYIINDIKKELHANMNGVASAHARQTEDYRVNWGVELPRVRNIADEIAENCIQRNLSQRELAQALWKESTRECKILACMLMPADEFDEEVCDIWAESIHTEEIATMFCLFLMQRLRYASTKAYEWMAREERMLQTCGFLTLCHLMRKYELSPDAQEEFLDQAAASLDNKYALKALQIYASLSEDNARKVKKVADYL
ncbi:MAG: DNA alkylation repair protein [Bacteroidaceae bacterium]|nr:DNA alkylation repair protein [Bacteroidaceae bacterium]